MAMKISIYTTDNAVFTNETLAEWSELFNLESAINHGDLAQIDKTSALLRRKSDRKTSKKDHKLVMEENVRRRKEKRFETWTPQVSRLYLGNAIACTL